MVLCTLILKEEDLLDEILHEFKEKNIKNITVLSSLSMVNEYVNKNKNRDLRIFGTLRHLVDYYSDDSRILLVACDEKLVDSVYNSAKKIIPEHQYLLFSISINNIQGKLE